MKEIRVHGRGGQGAVTAAQLLAIAAFHEGKQSQAFPRFGVERRGAPVEAFTRISGETINIRSGIYHPDIIVVLDPSLIEAEDVTNGLKPKGTIIVNSIKDPKELIKNHDDYQIFAVDATSIAMNLFKKPIVNTAILGAFAAATKLVSLESLNKAIEERFEKSQKLIDINKKAVKEAYEKCQQK
jgi:pyruvate ferredoxin oxidoreductase gamma subunit